MEDNLRKRISKNQIRDIKRSNKILAKIKL
jgi:hypothetical protein